MHIKNVQCTENTHHPSGHGPLLIILLVSFLVELTGGWLIARSIGWNISPEVILATLVPLFKFAVGLIVAVFIIKLFTSSDTDSGAL